MINKKSLKISLAVIAGLMLYYLITELTGWSMPCVFHRITGFKCPGCGITGMCTALIKLDFTGAFYSHPFIFVTLPYLIYIIVKTFLKGIFNAPCSERFRLNKFDNVTLIIYIAALIIFAVLRNAADIINGTSSLRFIIS